MTLKTAALIAFVGTLLVTVVLVWDLIRDVMGVMNGLIPALKLFPSLIYAFGAVTVTVFFCVFQKRSN